MNEPWIDPGILGSILGGTFGTFGAIVGTLGGVLAPKGKAKKLVMGVCILTVGLSVILLIAGIVAYLSGQPRAVWSGFGYTGLLCTVMFSISIAVIRKRYTEAELRKSMSEDLTVGDNNGTRKD